MNKNICLFFIITFFLLSPLTLVGAIDTLPLQENNNLLCSDLKNSFYNENIKTRSDLKAYFDIKSNELINTVSANAQGFIDENFRVLDERMNNLANKLLIKACVGLICSLLFALALWSLIKRSVRKVNDHKAQVLQDGLQR